MIHLCQQTHRNCHQIKLGHKDFFGSFKLWIYQFKNKNKNDKETKKHSITVVAYTLYPFGISCDYTAQLRSLH